MKLPPPVPLATVGPMRSLALLMALIAAGAWAQGLPNDLALAGLGSPAGPSGAAHDGAFRAMARQLAAAITSANLAPPRTLGHSAFALDAEVSVVDLQGGTLPTRSPFQGPLVVPSLHLRKGLPASFELGARAAWLEKSSMGVATLELKWALNEGFTYLPDIAVRANLSKLINGRDLELTAGGLDLGIGKQFAIGGMVTLTPYVGWHLLFVEATTAPVDFDAGRTLAQADAQPSASLVPFTPSRALDTTANRFYGGFTFGAGLVRISGEVSYAVGTSFKDAAGAATNVAPVLAWNAALGLAF